MRDRESERRLLGGQLSYMFQQSRIVLLWSEVKTQVLFADAWYWQGGLVTDSISRLCQAVPRISLTFGVEQADVRRLDRFHANQTMSVPSSKWERHTSSTQKQRNSAEVRIATWGFAGRCCATVGHSAVSVLPKGLLGRWPSWLCQIATIQSPTSPSKNSLWRSRHVASKTKDKRGGRTYAKNTIALGFYCSWDTPCYIDKNTQKKSSL